MEINIGDSVTLNDVEQKICKAVANARHKTNRKSNVHNAKVGNQSNEQTDLDGVSGEMAFCKLADIYPKDIFVIHPKSAKRGSDKKGDVTYLGKTVDIKTTAYRTGHLLATEGKTPDVDYFALIIRDRDKYVFKGFMKSTELLEDKRLKLFKKGQKVKSYVASQDELKEMPPQ